MIRAFQNLIRFGATPEEAALMTTKTPALSIGNEELGEIELGAPAIALRIEVRDDGYGALNLYLFDKNNGFTTPGRTIRLLKTEGTVKDGDGRRLPIVQSVDAILRGKLEARNALAALMERDLKHE